jgi:hypothetical protein
MRFGCSPGGYLASRSKDGEKSRQTKCLIAHPSANKLQHYLSLSLSLSPTPTPTPTPTPSGALAHSLFVPFSCLDLGDDREKERRKKERVQIVNARFQSSCTASVSSFIFLFCPVVKIFTASFFSPPPPPPPPPFFFTLLLSVRWFLGFRFFSFYYSFVSVFSFFPSPLPIHTFLQSKYRK